MYPYDLNTNLASIQSKLAEQVIKEDVSGDLDSIAGVDVSFSRGNQAVAAAVVMDLNTLQMMENSTLMVELLFPYIPGFLGFREADATVSVLNSLKSGFDVLMVNGHGIIHPRGFGLASHVGILMDMPTLGVAKRLTVGRYKKGVVKVNDNCPLFIKSLNKMLGAYINGNYVSIGHKISLNTAIKLVKETSLFKTPEPLRQAHILATNTFKRVLDG
ncbi:MAG TPA: endonuclease V [Methanobacterium sp.]